MSPRERERPSSSPATADQDQPSSDRDRAVSQALATLEHSVAAIQDSATFRAYLTAQARFHTYSWGNVLLILAQRREATQVAGFQTWKHLGRHVRKGEQGLKIIVPRGSARVAVDEIPSPDSTRNEDDTGIDEPAPPRVGGQAPLGRRHPVIAARRFGVATVFDVAQTDGRPLPAINVPVLEGDEGQQLYMHLEHVAVNEGLTVERGSEQLGSATMGFYTPAERRIVLREAPTRQMTKTLAHELAHHFGGATTPSAEEETTAESVAYVVCARFGLDTGQRSFPYVATWSRDQRVFRGALGRIQALSHQIIERVEDHGAMSLATKRSHDLP